VLVLAFLALWFIGYPGERTPLTLPWEGAFWLHFANLIALGFGYGRVSAVPGFAYLALILALLALHWLRWRTSDAELREKWLALSLLLGGLLASLASISVGRAWAGPGGAKSGRYGEVALFVVPVAWVLIRSALKRLGRMPRVEIAGVFLASAALLIPLHSFLEYDRIYRREGERRLAGLRCLHEHYYRGGASYCPDLYYDPQTAPVVEERAVALQVSFVREHSPTRE
jgi:hypothetical protein